MEYIFLLQSSLNKVRTQGISYNALIWPDQLHRMMPCVTSNARMANNTPSCLGAAVPIIFHESPWVAIILAELPTTLFLSLRQSVLQPLPLWSAYSSCHLVLWLSTSTWQAPLMTITFVLRLTGRKQLTLSLASYDGTGAMRLRNSYFFFLFCLGVILIYSPRSYEAGAFLFRPCVDSLRPWTMIFP